MSAKVIFNRNFNTVTSKRILSRLVNPFILAIILLLFSSSLSAAEKGSVAVKPRFRVFALKHISTEQARNILVDADLGTVSQLPADNMILVTGQPRQLIKASALLKLFDAEKPVVMKAILPASAVGLLPPNEQIEAEIGNMSIGSFSNPPSGVGKDKAIIDVHNDSVVAIAPAEKLDKIIEAIGRSNSNGSIKQLQKGKYEVPEPEKPKIDAVAEAEIERVKAEFQKIKAELNGRNGSYVSAQVGADTSDSEASGLFNKLLDSLDEAEKKIAQLSPPAPNEPEPNKPPIQPDTPITPEKKEPNEPSVIPEQPKEKVIEPVKEAKKPEPVKPEPKKVSTKLPSKREPNAVPEKVTIEIEEPNRVAPILREDPNKVTEVVEPNAVTEIVEPNAVAEVVEPNKVTRIVEPVTVKGPYEPAYIANGSDTLKLDLPPKINIMDLLDLLGKYLGLNYMYDPADVTGLKGEVHLKIQGPIKVKELYPLAESVLRFKGFVMTRRDNTVFIVPLQKIGSIDAQIVDPNKPQVQAGDVIITRIFELKHIDTASAQSLLTAMKLGVSVSPIASIKTLIITGYAYRMERIESLLDMIDKPGEQKEFRCRELQFTTAKTLAAKVKTLAEQLGTVSITISVPTTTPTVPTVPGRRPSIPTRPPTRPTTPTPTAAPTKPTVYLDADERTNRILMIGLEEQLSVVDNLIDALDVEQKDLRTLRLYEIQHVDAEEVMTKLSELGIISGGRAATSSSRAPIRTTPASRTTAGRPPTPTSRVSTPSTTTEIQEPLAEEPQVVIIEPTNSLLVNGTAEQHVQIATIIGYVDAEQEETQNPYVIYPLENQEPEELTGTLEKLISETITEQQAGADSKVVRTTTTRRKIEEDISIVPDSKSYSIIVYASKKNQQWIASLIKDLDEYRPQVLLDVTLVEITKNELFDLDLDATVFSGLPELSFSSTTGAINKSSVTAFYKDEQINILLEALHEKGYGRILARPKLLVNDNEEGTIKSEEQTSVAQIQTKIIPGTAATASTASQDVSFQSYTAGITLTITPHISKGEQLGLTITLTRSDFRLRDPTKIGKEGDEDVYPTPPDILTSDVTSKVTVPNGTTIILGGLERIRQTKGGTKVPFIGDIPLIGGLFRTTSNKDDQSRLYVFVKAHILRPGEEMTGASDIEAVSAKNRASFEEFEKEMQEYEDWPGIKPKPMDPLRILEADEEVSLSDRRVFEKRGQTRREGKGLTRTKSQVMYPM